MSVRADLLAMIAEEDARPADFHARYGRRASGLDRLFDMGGPRRGWALGIGAMAVVTLPAFAAQGTLERFTIGDAVDQQVEIEPMPFEQTGESFPGSAFYYLDLQQGPPRIGEGIHSDAEPAPAASLLLAPARPLRIDNSGVDRARAVECLTAAVYYEAASEPDAGQRAVAQVVLNRVASLAYPNTVCGVVYQGSERASGCQFTFTCDGSLARRPSPMFWDRARKVAGEALAGYVYAPVGLATHYHTVQVNPYWAASLNYIGTIGAHRFYSMRGGAGSPATFRFAYTGREPLPGPHARLAADTPLSAGEDPLAIERAWANYGVNAGANGNAILPGQTLGAPPQSAFPMTARPAPDYASAVAKRGGDDLFTARNLPQAQGIKAEYARAGNWIGGVAPGSTSAQVNERSRQP